MGELYEADVFEWSQHQAALLRRRAAGELVHEAELDWPHIAEEIESVGKEQLHAVESFLLQALLHDLKAEAWPLTSCVEGWRADARRFRIEAAARFTASMRQRVDLAKIYRRALKAMPDRIDGQPPLPVPDTCPVTLGELLAEGDAL